MSRFDWRKSDTEKKRRKNEIEYAKSDFQKKAETASRYVTTEIMLHRDKPPKGMRPCDVLWCRTFIKTGTKLCGFHGKKRKTFLEDKKDQLKLRSAFEP